MNYAQTDSHAEQAQAEIRAKAQQAKDAIAVKVGWMIRSDGQRRRYEKAKLKQQEKTQ